MRYPETLTAWAYALGCGKTRVAHGMLKILGSAGADHDLPICFEEHLETELRHAEWLHRVVDSERRSYLEESEYCLIEGRMAQAMECYVRALSGYAERQTLCLEAQYCMATLALGSRSFRHSAELRRFCGALELSQALARVVEEEVRHVRTAQELLQDLPRETRGLYRSVRAFEEMLFDRMIRKFFQALELYECSVSKRPTNPHWLARCV